MKKIAFIFAGCYVLYGLMMGWYLFYGADMGIPAQYRGTAADPATFMSEAQTMLTHDYSRLQDWLYFLSVPLEWAVYLFVLLFGVSLWMRNQNRRVRTSHRLSLIHSALFMLMLSLLSWLISFPISWLSYRAGIHYGVTTQPFADWMRDNVISFWINWGILLVTVWAIYLLMKKTKRWWFYTWLLSIPFTIFLMYIQPVVIDPLYNNFYRLQDDELKGKILNLADEADIPAKNVYVVNKSEETNALNAYVNGIGSNLRIVLWDTTLEKLDDDEILFVMAHEMGHYVKNHLFWNLLGSIVMTFVGLFITARLLIWIVGRWGDRLGIHAVSSLATLPLLLLIFSVLSFAVTPIGNAVSRQAEHAADVYGLQTTHDPEAAIGFFHKSAPISLSEMDPPGIVKFFQYGHPTDLERILYFMKQKAND